MKWLPPALALIVLAVFIISLLGRRSRAQEIGGLILFALSLFIYHLGDLGLWAGWDYETTRRIASFGFYLQVPLLLYLVYICLPESRRTTAYRIVWALLSLPWVVALLMLGSQALVYLEGMPGKNETLISTLVVAYIIAFLFGIVRLYQAVKLPETHEPALSRTIARTSLIYLIALVALWSLIEITGYDPTYLFGLASIFWIISIGINAFAVTEKAHRQVTV